MQWLSPAQCVGYVAFVLGIIAFLQTNDRRLKILNALECVVYAVHFGMLGNASAAMSATLSTARNLASVKTRALWVAIFFIVANIALGFWFVKSPLGWIPVIGTCVATVAFFMMRGLPMRLMLLCSTLCWLANNIVSHSIGGTALEATIALTNITTMARMFFVDRKSAAIPLQAD
ncbi:MAG TPA: YgjV family protein [candidate division Zixibacteria bacterium]|nr:YgjV family protein [Candidatus Acidoferrales bacterium]HVP63822.1 YgjV family protein [candidate division Zixibacteria bacterium]